MSNLTEIVKAEELRQIELALEKHKSNSAAARALGIPRTTLIDKRKRHGLKLVEKETDEQCIRVRKGSSICIEIQEVGNERLIRMKVE
jgi:hypothetical protein